MIIMGSRAKELFQTRGYISRKSSLEIHSVTVMFTFGSKMMKQNDETKS